MKYAVTECAVCRAVVCPTPFSIWFLHDEADVREGYDGRRIEMITLCDVHTRMVRKCSRCACYEELPCPHEGIPRGWCRARQEGWPVTSGDWCLTWEQARPLVSADLVDLFDLPEDSCAGAGDGGRGDGPGDGPNGDE